MYAAGQSTADGGIGAASTATDAASVVESQQKSQQKDRMPARKASGSVGSSVFAIQSHGSKPLASNKMTRIHPTSSMTLLPAASSLDALLHDNITAEMRLTAHVKVSIRLDPIIPLDFAIDHTIESACHSCATLTGSSCRTAKPNV